MSRSRTGAVFLAPSSSGGRKSGSLAGLEGEGTGENESLEELGESGEGESMLSNSRGLIRLFVKDNGAKVFSQNLKPR